MKNYRESWVPGKNIINPNIYIEIYKKYGNPYETLPELFDAYNKKFINTKEFTWYLADFIPEY